VAMIRSQILCDPRLSDEERSRLLALV